MAHPYAVLISSEVERAEADLTAFRSRALTVVTTSSGVVTVLTGLVTFAASTADRAVGLSAWSILFIALALAAFVVATVLALAANRTRSTEVPDLDGLASVERWNDGDSDSEHERVASAVLIPYVNSLHAAAKQTAVLLDGAILSQVVGIVLASISAVIMLTEI